MNILYDAVIKYIKTKMPVTVVSCKCETCGVVFLEEMFLSDFVEKSNSFNAVRMKQPDTWYKLAEQHFKEKPAHEILFKCPPIVVPELALLGQKEFNFLPRDLSAFWREHNMPNRI